MVASDRATSNLGGKLADAVEFEAILGKLLNEQEPLAEGDHESDAERSRQLARRDLRFAELGEIAQRRSAVTAKRVADLQDPELDEGKRWAAIFAFERDHRYVTAAVGSQLQRDARRRTLLTVGGLGSMAFGLAFAFLAPVRRRASLG